MQQADKECLGGALIGHHEHGKTTLAAALWARRDERGSGAPGEVEFSRSFQPRPLPIETATRRVVLLDCPGHPNYTKNLWRALVQVDVVVLVVAATEGLMPQTREHLLLARQAGVTRAVVFLSKTDRVGDPEVLDLVEHDLRQLLGLHGFPPDRTPIVRGSIDVLLSALDAAPQPPRDERGPFRMPITDYHYRLHAGTRPEDIVTGRVERGVVEIGDELEVVGLARKPALTRAVSIQEFRRYRGPGRAGHHIGVQLRGRLELRRGQVLARPGTVEARRQFEASLYLPPPEGRG